MLPAFAALLVKPRRTWYAPLLAKIVYFTSSGSFLSAALRFSPLELTTTNHVNTIACARNTSKGGMQHDIDDELRRPLPPKMA